ncbi:MAG: hypothetical protein D6729_17860 [Deltaproteobacteria bacterium]|nr:MAG: hypothetical protein D6729_17860 [Deltaproteobacteria bacterium]
MLEKVSALLDGELPEDEVASVEAWLEAHPEAAESLVLMRAVGEGLREAADGWEKGVDFEHFYEGVAARIGPEALAGGPVPEREAPAQPGLFARLTEWLHRPALVASLATVLVAVGIGSAMFLQQTRPTPVSLRGKTEIEALDFETASAVVYQTPAQVTVIWLEEEEAQ